jgi:glycosyltransferase involved in cell wall biosynthesis
MRLAWFSPLPPTPSGISDYSAELLPYIAKRAHVDVYCQRSALAGLWRRRFRPEGTEVLPPAAFESHAPGYDAVFYHLGNNPHHRFVYEAFLERPGVAVFHDFLLHHLIAASTVEQPYKRRSLTPYRDRMEQEYGEAGARLARLRWNHVASEFEKFLFPLNRHVADRALMLVAHNRDVGRMLSIVAPEIPVAIIPHHAGRPPGEVTGVSRLEARRRLRLPADRFLVGHFGFLTRPKQPAAVIGGFAKLAAGEPRASLLIVGADRSGGGLARLIAKHGLEDRVAVAGYVDLVRFYLYLKAVDAVVNLRYPSAGESSGTFARALAEGRATIVNDIGSFAEIPSDVALKVDVDGDQADQVGSHLVRLRADPSFRSSIEERAKRYAREVLSPERCSDLYLQVARTVATARRAETVRPGGVSRVGGQRAGSLPGAT